MKILDNLKKIFEAKFSDILNNTKITIFDFSRNTNNTLEIKNESTLSIDLSKVTLEEKNKIKRDVIDVAIQEENEPFLSDKSKEKTEKIKENLPKDDDQQLLKFYRDKLPLDLYKALEASLVVRNVFKNKGDIQELKKDIMREYPEFGKNLCNMTTEGYFHEHFKELYDSMILEEDFDIIDYQKKVRKIVVSLPYIVFVTRYKKFDEIAGEVEYKYRRLKKYGTGKLRLHAIGKDNVMTVFKILNSYKNNKNIEIDIEVNDSQTVITATLRF